MIVKALFVNNALTWRETLIYYDCKGGLGTIKQAVTPLAEKYEVARVDLFGSYAKGNATDSSDLDFLVEFCVDIPSIFKVMGLKEELQASLNRSVDIVTLPLTRPNSINIEKAVNVYELR